MLFARRGRGLFGFNRTSPGKRGRSIGGGFGSRSLRLEPLEDRSLLSVGVSGCVHIDWDQDGFNDTTIDIEDVSIELYSSNDEIIGNADDVLQDTSTYISRSGYYSFDGLPYQAGLHYYVQMSLPGNFAFAGDSDDSDFDANGLTQLFTLDDGEYAYYDVLVVSTTPTREFQLGTENAHSCGNAIALDSEGNMYVTGYFSGNVDFDPSENEFVLSSESQHAFIAKYSVDGELIWADDLTPLSATNGIDITVVANDYLESTTCIYATGSYHDGSDGGFYVTKIDSDGVAIWTKTVSLPNYQPGVDDRDTATAITTSASGYHVSISGCFSDVADFDPGENTHNLTSAGDQDAFVLQLGCNGYYRWAISEGGTAYDAAMDIASHFSGDVYTTGVIDNNCFVLRANTNGEIESFTSTSGSGSAVGKSIIFESNSGVYVAGYYQGTVEYSTSEDFTLTSANEADYSLFLMKVGPLLDLDWVLNTGESVSVPTVDLYAMTEYVHTTIYVSSKVSSLVSEDPLSYSNSYVLDAFREFGYGSRGVTPLFTQSASSESEYAGIHAGGLVIADDWSVIITGGFSGTLVSGYSDGALSSVGVQDLFVSQFNPFLFGITDLQINRVDQLDTEQPVGTLVGELSAIDSLDASLRYSLVSGDGDDDNDCFYIEGNQLKTTAQFNYAGKYSYKVRIRAADENGQWTEKSFIIYATDITQPKVTINVADDQDDPATESPLHFVVVFSEPVDGFTADDITVVSTVLGNLEVTVDDHMSSGGYDGMHYDVYIRGMIGPGAITASIPAGVVDDWYGDLPNLASTSTDNSIDFAPTALFLDVGSLGIDAVGWGDAAWGDYDNDGLLDVVVAGSCDIAEIYHNNGDGTFSPIGAGLTGGWGACVDWGDYNNDGLLDIIISGDLTYIDEGGLSTEFYTKVYTNLGNGVFQEADIELPGVSYGTSIWGDYDNDGWLDILIAGTCDDSGSVEHIIAVYQNTGYGTFEEVVAGIEEENVTAASWGDYDNDGLLDLVLQTYSTNLGWTYSVKLYHNDGHNAFSDVSASLGVTEYDTTSPAWGDFDNDGLSDILLSREIDDEWETVICHNNGDGTFSLISTGLPATENSNLAWGDYNNDGLLDILLNAVNGENCVYVYRNNGDGTFTDLELDLPGTYDGSADWGDYNGDGWLDILLTGYDNNLEAFTYVYYNNVGNLSSQPFLAMASLSLAIEEIAANTVPDAPTNLTVQQLSATSVLLSYDAAVDAETPSDGLSYVIRVGTTPGGCDVVSAMSTHDGARLVAERGSIQGTSWELTGLTPGTTYYWSVQAVDTALAGSAFATEGSFKTSMISKVVVGEALSGSDRDGVMEDTDKLIVTWAIDTVSGLASQTLTIDGQAVASIGGPTAGYCYGVLGNLTAGEHTFTIEVVDRHGATDTYTGTFTVTEDTDPAGPEISRVVVAEALSGSDRDGVMEDTDKLVITFKAVSNTGITAKSLTIDGTAYAVNRAGTSDNYYCVIGKQTAGTHTYQISMTDAGGTATADNTFDVAADADPIGPEISLVTVAEAVGGSDRDGVREDTDKLVITMKVTSDAGITAKSLTVDGTAYTVFRSGTSDYYYCPIGKQTAGTHNYEIAVTDADGETTVGGAFTVASGMVAPEISRVVVAEALSGSDLDGNMEVTDKLLVTWAVAADSRIVAKSLTIDGTAYNVHRSGTSDYYYCVLGQLSAGEYSFTISVTDAAGLTGTHDGTFEVNPVSILLADDDSIDGLLEQDCLSSEVTDEVFAEYGLV